MGQDPSDVVAPEIAGGSLAHSKTLGFSEDSLVDGTGIRKLAMIGLLPLIAGFLLPIHDNFVDSTSAWSALDRGPSIALLFPLVAIVLGLVAFLAPLSSWVRSAILMSAGAFGLASLPFLGEFSGSPEKFMPLILLGTLIAGWGLVLRSLDAQADMPRRILIAGAVLTLIGFLIPMSSAGQSLPIEVRFFLHGEMGSSSPLGAYSEAFNRSPMVAFSVFYLFLPLVLLPIAAVIAYPKPSGAWDKMGLILKPITWIIVLYIPIGFVLFLLNMMGGDGTEYVIIDKHYISDDEFRSGAMYGRLRQLLLATSFALWAVVPVVSLAKRFLAPAPKETQD